MWELLWFRSVFESNALMSLSSAMSGSNPLSISKFEPSLETCYTKDNGKSFAKCANVVGTGVHTSTIVANASNISSYDQAKVMRTHNSSVHLFRVAPGERDDLQEKNGDVNHFYFHEKNCIIIIDMERFLRQGCHLHAIYPALDRMRPATIHTSNRMLPPDPSIADRLFVATTA